MSPPTWSVVLPLQNKPNQVENAEYGAIALRKDCTNSLVHKWSYATEEYILKWRSSWQLLRQNVGDTVTFSATSSPSVHFF